MSNALVILCGGDSSRMGTDKALLPFKDKTVVEYIYDKFSPYFDKIYLSVNERGIYQHLGLNIREIPDIYLNAGPTGAILSSLTMITEEKAVFISIDTPFLDPRICLYLLENSEGYDITTYGSDNSPIEAMCAVYSKRCIGVMGKCLITNSFTKENFQSKCLNNIIDTNIIGDISDTSYEQQFFPLTDRRSYYMALFSVINSAYLMC